MRSYFLLLTASFVSVICVGQTAQDKASVEAVIRLFQQDFNDGSFKHAPTYTTPDWGHINPGGGIDKGRDNVLNLVRSVHQTFLKGVTMKIESMAIRFLTPDVSIGDVVHQMDDYITPDGVKHKNERQIKTYVFVKRKGKWLLAQDHNTVISTP
ncbi:SgcJ/EcaC family oxidoreductase [Spirosoma sp. BT702]|uniref:SgcJ/EcaC family oxidoreductase n=1 Tax=Spirosoma profusum TaxID=2771354 RepID=A0A927GA37_9BACT|nr:SgcJ/EcaC family oxidoreductase [Spirosoma profusum]MBD2705098.1 SgcJ/EcaC family oxidoreductase [Spirosoma profusum]